MCHWRQLAALVTDWQAIRKKIETDLAKKRGGGTSGSTLSGPGGPNGTPSRSSGGRRRGQAGAAAGAAGTVSSLRPTPALTVPQHISVADASQLCAAKRTDCVLVVDDEEHLCGIFTAKDLAFRVVGDGLDPRDTSVQSIMTPNPMVTRDTTSATDALQTMVTRHFRHLVSGKSSVRSSALPEGMPAQSGLRGQVCPTKGNERTASGKLGLLSSKQARDQSADDLLHSSFPDCTPRIMMCC